MDFESLVKTVKGWWPARQNLRPPFELVSPEEAAIRERRQREIREMIAGIKER